MGNAMSEPQGAINDADRAASAWLATLGESSVTAETLAEFEIWRSNPDNAAAYRRVERLWKGAEALAGDPDIRAITRDALDQNRAPVLARRPVSRQTWAAVVATGAVAVAALGLGFTWVQSRGVYATEIGEQRLVRLDDGSTVRLDTASRLRVRFEAGRRDVALEEGQALFTVAHDARRPFTVTAGVTRVTALGTVFDVRRSAAGARVTLVVGAVDVRNTGDARSAWRLAPGQQIVAASAAQVRSVNPALATSWAQGRLVFQNTTLSDAVTEVNRYLPDKIVLDAGYAGSKTLNGVFVTGDGDAFVSAAVEVFDLVAVRQPDGGVRLTTARSSEK